MISHVILVKKRNNLKRIAIQSLSIITFLSPMNLVVGMPLFKKEHMVFGIYCYKKSSNCILT